MPRGQKESCWKPRAYRHGRFPPTRQPTLHHGQGQGTQQGLSPALRILPPKKLPRRSLHGAVLRTGRERRRRPVRWLHGDDHCRFLHETGIRQEAHRAVHPALERGAKVFSQTSSIVLLPADTTEDEHLALVGLLNSSVACFWLKQACCRGARCLCLAHGTDW